MIQAANELGWCTEQSVPLISETNGVAERINRHVEEGIRALLVSAGLNDQWWSFAGRFFCMAANIVIIDGDSAWNKRFGKGQFEGQRIPLGALIDFLPPKPVRQQMSKSSSRGGLASSSAIIFSQAAGGNKNTSSLHYRNSGAEMTGSFPTSARVSRKISLQGQGAANNLPAQTDSRHHA